MVIMLAFQAGDGGSIPLTRSQKIGFIVFSRSRNIILSFYFFMFTINIIIKHPKISVILKSKDKTLDEAKWEDNSRASVELLSNIDKILKKNKIKKEDIKNISVETLQTTYSSARIAKAISLMANYCLTNFPKHVE